MKKKKNGKLEIFKIQNIYVGTFLTLLIVDWSSKNVKNIQQNKR